MQLFMSGAAGQCDMFDYKPELIKRHGQPFDPGEKVELFQSNSGACLKSPWDWIQYGQCGKWMSDLVPHLGSCVDEIAFLHSMVSKSNVHLMGIDHTKLTFHSNGIDRRLTDVHGAVIRELLAESRFDNRRGASLLAESTEQNGRISPLPISERVQIGPGRFQSGAARIFLALFLL